MVYVLRLRRVDASLITDLALRSYLAKAEGVKFFREARRVFDFSSALKLNGLDRASLMVRRRFTSAALGASRWYEALLAGYTAA
ncbi:hypothetical protein OOZ63_16130 [Paucibacter sp. PLA-PC-4]|uniref:hypothetical protein n=1 Tax=Paucibacter sp. PLA-PC-4 TaxID=2993655 RepID=UPI002248D8AA|nr:hypothetical protein [Paucibacter sp. PLA-PC-4]MCX2863360.1 hypothetical protein [Paucibacter sp. PLA-PC-4]